MKFELPFASLLKGVERRVINVTAAIFIGIFAGSIISDYMGGNAISYLFALINATFISLSVGAVMIISKSREKEKEKKNYREIAEKRKRKK